MFQPEISVRTVRMMGKAMADAFLVPFKDLPKVLFHAAILSLIIGGFWLLDSLKDPVLSAIVGMEYQPYAKVVSVVFTLVVVCCYDYLTSVVTKPSLFHIISLLFGIIFMIIAAMLSHPTTGLDNKTKHPRRLLGWFCYFAIEVYGSLMVALFWSFTNSLMDLEQAKGAYGLIICFAQVGAISGSTLATHAGDMGIPQLFLIASVSVLMISLLIKVYHIVFRDTITVQVESGRVRRMTGASEDLAEMLHTNAPASTSFTTSASTAPSTSPSSSVLQSVITAFSGFYEGLFLIVKYPYVLHIMGVTCLYEIVLTVMDYQFKLLGSSKTSGDTFDEESADAAEFVNLLGHFGQFTNILSLLVSSIGFSFLTHRLGVRYTLLVFPLILFVAVIVTNLVHSLWVMFFFVSILKAIVYSLNDPVKELLYMPTSEPIKFKAKAWIDVLGSRIAKAMGSLISGAAAGDPRKLRTISEIPCILISLFLVVVAFVAGRMFDRLVRDGIIIGNEEVEDIGTELNSLTRKTGKDSAANYYSKLERRNGLAPGDVGYDGYDLHLFDGVFASDDEGGTMEGDVDYSGQWPKQGTTGRQHGTGSGRRGGDIVQDARGEWYSTAENISALRDSGVLRDESDSSSFLFYDSNASVQSSDQLSRFSSI